MPAARCLLAIVLCLALGAGACGNDSRVSTRDDDATSTTAAGGDAGGDADSVDAGDDPASGDGTSDAADGAGADTAGDDGGSLGDPPPAPTAPAAAQPTRPGTYRYDVQGTVTQSGPLGGTDPLPSPAVLTVDPPDGGRQRTVLDARDDDGEGSVTTTVLQYRDDGVYLESLKLQTRVSGVTITYEFRPEPPPLVAPTGAGVGFHTQFTLTSTNGGLRTTTTLDVVDREMVTIGGASIDTFKVRTHTVVEGDADGESTSTTNFDRGNYLSVRDHTVSDLDTQFGRFQSEATSTLRSADPS